MPPKRKATTAKASEKAEAVANGSENVEPPKPKRGKQAKQADQGDAVVERTRRPTRNAAAAKAAGEVSPVEEKLAKAKSARQKGAAGTKTKATKQKAEPKGTAKSTKAKSAKNKPAAAESAPIATKSKRGAKKGNDETEENKISTNKPKASKKKAPSSDADVETEDKPKTKRTKKLSESGSDSVENHSEESDQDKVSTKSEEAKTSTAKPKATKKKAAPIEVAVDADADDEPKSKKERLQKLSESDSDSGEVEGDQVEESLDVTCDKANALGDLPNFKISSWNVDGVRAWMKKNGLKYVEQERPDILCLQETKCGKDKIPDELNKFMNYKTYWHDSVKSGYAGVALFTAADPLSVIYGIGDKEFDDEGRCITAEFDNYYVVNVYVPNAGRGLVTLPKRLEWNKIFNEYIAKLDEKKPVIICGDMNVAHTEIDLTNPKSNKKNAGFTVEEREGFTEFLSDKYVDTFRSLYPDRTDAYTFWSFMRSAREKNIGWRLDYFIVSKRLMDNVCDNVMRTSVLGSDHCPITLYLNL